MKQNESNHALSVDPGSSSQEQNRFVFYLLLFIVAFVPRLVHLLSIADNPFFGSPIIDCHTNDVLAQRISGGDWLGYKPFWQAPLYPYFLGILYTVFGRNLFLVRFIQILLGSVNCLLLYRIAKTTFNPKIALISFSIAAFYGPFLFFDAELLNPVLVIFFNLMVVTILLSFQKKPKWTKLLLAGVMLGLSSITHGLAMTFVPFAVLWLVMLLIRSRSSIPKILVYNLLFILGFLLVISATTARNMIAGKDLVFVSSNAGINFFIGNNPDYDKTTSIRPGIEWEELIQRPMQEGFEEPSERSAYFFRQAFSYITDRPLSYLKLLLRKTFFILDGFEIRRNQDPYMFRGYSVPLGFLLWKWLIYFPYGLLLPFGLVGMVAFFRERYGEEGRNSKAILLFYFLISQAVALIFFFVCARYRLPLVPFLIVFAAFGLNAIYRKIKAKSSKELILLLLVLLVFLVISNLSHHQPGVKDLAEEHYNLGMAYAQQEKYDQALQEYNQAVKLQPDHLMAQFKIALAYDNRGMLDQAENKYLEVIDIFPRAALAYNNLGLIYEKKGDFLKAEEYYIKASDAHPLLPDPVYNLGNVLLEQKSYDSARENFVACIALDPYYYKAHSALGELNFRTGKMDEAIKNFKRAIKINPDYSVAHNNLGASYAGKGQRLLAFEEFETAAKLDPDYGPAYLNLGNWYLEDRKPKEAIPYYQRATELMPDDPSVHYHLAMAYGFTGRERDATAELYRALAADSTFLPAKELLQKVMEQTTGQ